MNSRFHPDPSASCAVALRRFPFPYKAAFAICSDIDLCTVSSFRKIHHFLNDPSQGLGLPVADSFFGCSIKPPQLSYLDPQTLKPGNDAPFIREALHAGLIDSFHGWGDFNETVPDAATVQTIARTMVDEFIRYDLSVPVWINHGSINNIQNIHCRLYPFFCGDNPASRLYTAHHFPGLGIRYVWRTEAVAWPLSTDGKQDRKERFIRESLHHVKNTVKVCRGMKHRTQPKSYLESLCSPFTFNDGSVYTGFSRWNPDPAGVWHRPKRTTLHHQITDRFLDNIIACSGYAILYTHLGLPVMADGDELFTADNRRVLEKLARRHHDGELWVAPTSRLLDYWTMWHSVRWRVVSPAPGTNSIIIDAPPGCSACAGLTFTTSSPATTAIIVNGKPAPVMYSHPDSSGSGAVWISIGPAPSIDPLR